METKGRNRVPSAAQIFFLDLSIWCKTYHVSVLLQKSHLRHKTKWLYQHLTSMHRNFLWRCQFTTAATRMLHNFVFLCILYRCLKSSRITTCDLGKEIVMNDILSCNSKMILSCKSCLLDRAWATGYKIHWEENVIFLQEIIDNSSWPWRLHTVWQPHCLQKNNNNNKKTQKIHHLSFFHHTVRSRHCWS